MSSFFDEASLVFIPSGYKTSKAYSVKPTSGDGDLAFTRSNDTATRVGPDGLIEKVRTNLATYSNTFSDGSWAKVTDGTYSLVTESITDAFGNTSAVFKVTLLTGSFLVFRKTLASATTQTTNFSLYVKKTISSTYVGIDVDDNTDVAAAANTNWQRISNTRATASFVDITTYSVGEPFYIFASQVEYGDIATDYIATTTAAVSVGPVANVPRLDYLNSSCPRLLLEPQRTNLRTSSEQFSSLSPSNVTVTSNDTTSPDGYANADKLTPSGSGFHTIGNNISVTAGQKYTISIFYKYGTHKNIGFYDNNTAGSEITINMETNAFTLGANVDAGGVVPYGNGWYRAYATFTAGNANMVNYIIFRDNTNNGNYTGDGSYSWFYGWQVEAGAYATSYIPTLGAAVTRGADAALKTSISSLIGQDEGTIFVEFEYNYSDSTTQVLFKANQTTDANSVGIEVQGTTIKGLVNSGGGNIATITGTIATGTIKAALAYKTNDMAFYVNGTQVGVDTSGSIAFAGVVDILTIGQFLLNGGTFFPASRPFNQALVFKTRLSNADLAALTA